MICAGCLVFAFCACIYSRSLGSRLSIGVQNLLESYSPAVRQDRASKHMGLASFRLDLPPPAEYLAALANHVRIKHVQRCPRISHAQILPSYSDSHGHQMTNIAARIHSPVSQVFMPSRKT
jgi:hypothetical protein